MTTQRSQLFTPQAQRTASRTTASSALNRSVQAIRRPAHLVKGSPSNKENTAIDLTRADEVMVNQTPVKVFPTFLSPTSAVLSTPNSIASSVSSSLSSLSTPRSVIVISPRQPLAVRSPNVTHTLSPAIQRTGGDKPQLAVTKAVKPTSLQPSKAKRSSPPSTHFQTARVNKAAAVKPTHSSSHSRPVVASSRPTPTSSASPPLRSQLQLLRSQLSEEKERSAVLLAEVQRLRHELTEEKRKGRGREEDDEVAGHSYYKVQRWDYYEAVNSAPSSASDSGSASEGEEEEAQEEEEEEVEPENQVSESDVNEEEEVEEEDQDINSDVEEDEAESVADDEEDSEAELSDSTVGSALQRSMSHSRSARPSTSSVEEDDLVEQMAAASIKGEMDDEEQSHRSLSTSSSHTTASSASSLSSSPNFHDVFPYERNLYLLSRHYHFHHRLYTCQDAVTFKATHIHTNQPVVIKVSEGYSPNRSHPKEVRLLTRAQGHGNIMTLRGWYGIESTKCYAFVTDWVENVGLERVWGKEGTRRQYMKDMLRALQHLHSRGILYRDIKPSNVLWNEEQHKATIIDYDVATYFDAKRLHRSVVGTNGYMAPEMMKLEEVREEEEEEGIVGYDQQVDVYSAGVVFGQLLFHIHEDEVADLSRPETKGPAMVSKVLRWAHEHQGRIGAEYHLLLRMLTEDPQLRITVKDALLHPYFTQNTAAAK